jgi:hypothetical protein
VGQECNNGADQGDGRIAELLSFCCCVWICDDLVCVRGVRYTLCVVAVAVVRFLGKWATVADEL